MATTFTISSETLEEAAEEVETGLSSHEVRQVLLDYLRDEVEESHWEAVNACLTTFGLSLNRRAVATHAQRVQTLLDVEGLLFYSLTDEDLADTTWPLVGETLTVSLREE